MSRYSVPLRKHWKQHLTRTMHLQVLLLTLCLTSAWSLTKDTHTKGVLYPEYGLNLRQAGQILASSDSVFVTLVVNLPSSKDLPKEYISNTMCSSFSYKTLHGSPQGDMIEWNKDAKLNNVHPSLFSYYVNMCTRTQDITIQAETKVNNMLSKIHSKYKDIEVLADTAIKINISDMHNDKDFTDTNIELNHRSAKEHHIAKRSILSLLFSGVANVFGSIVNTVHARRITALESSVSVMQNNLITVKNQFVDLQRNSYNTYQHLYGLSRNLTTAFDAAIKEGRKHIKDINDRVNKFEFTLRYQSEALDYIVTSLSELSISFNFHVNQAITKLMEYDIFLARFVDGLGDIVNGKLSTSIIPPHQLEEILTQVQNSIELRKAHLEVLDVPTRTYYSRTNTIFAIHNGKLFIQLEVFTMYNKAHMFSLFEIMTIPMPFDMSNTSVKARPFTQLIPSKKFFAVSKNSYMELDQHQIEACEVYDSLHVCPQAILQRDSDSMSCISSIWFNSSKSDILTHCDFRYYPEHRQEPSVLDTGNEILISGFKTPWTIKCEHEFTMRHYHEVNYAVIPHTQLCGCAILGQGMHVKTFLEGCLQERSSFRPVFPINAAVYIMSEPKSLNISLNKLYMHASEIPFHPKSPTILEASDDNIAQQDDDDLVMDLLKVIKLETSKIPIFESKEDLTILTDSIPSWFAKGKLSYILITIGSILGTIAICIAVFAVTKGLRLSALLTTIHALPKAEAIGNSVNPSVSPEMNNLVTFSVINVSILIIVYITYKFIIFIIRKLNNMYFRLPVNFSESYKAYQSDIYVEIFDNHDYVCLKICSLRHHSSNLMLSMHEKPIFRHLEHGYIYDHLLLDLQGNLVVCKNSSSLLALPEFVLVPVTCKFKLRKMFKYMKEFPLKLRLISVSQGLVYDLLKHTDKVTYAADEQIQTDAILSILPPPVHVGVQVPDAANADPLYVEMN